MKSKPRGRSSERSGGSGGGSARSSRGRRATGPLAPDNYWTRSMRPLHVLVFLLPLVAAYEVGSLVYLSDHLAGRELSVSAYRLFTDFFRAFGLAGASLPSIALVVVFMTWHMMTRDRWRVDPETLGGMLLESIAWTLPLLVLNATVIHAQGAMAGLFAGGGGPTPLAQGGTVTLNDLPTGALLTIAVGAGLYEEMLFRLVGLALLHFILVDLIGLSSRWGYAIGIVVAALAFSVYHQGQTWPLFVFRTLAGVYLGTVYVMRGFGVVVGTHAIFDVLALVLLRR